MQRPARLSRLARGALQGWPLAKACNSCHWCFVSRHGETHLDILSDLANDEPLSPTQFSLSVPTR